MLAQQPTSNKNNRMSTKIVDIPTALLRTSMHTVIRRTQSPLTAPVQSTSQYIYPFPCTMDSSIPQDTTVNEIAPEGLS